MKSIWLFLIGLIINLGFVAITLVSYWVSAQEDMTGWEKPTPLPYLFVFLALIAAGIWARKTGRPGLANVLVMLPTALAISTLLILVVLFNLKGILPEGFGLLHLWVILLAGVAVFYSAKFTTRKNGMLNRIFEISRNTAAQPKEPVELKGQKVWFSNSGRGGHVSYESKEGSFNMYFELGGGDVVAVIDVPGPGEWLEKTGIPLEKREAVLHYIGAVTVQKQTQHGSFKLEGDSLLIYAK